VTRSDSADPATAVASTAAAEPLLAVRDLNIWFDQDGGPDLHCVRGVSFELEPGDRFGLVGESGCGKTTTMLAILGLLPPTASISGAVCLDGEEMLAAGEETLQRHRWKDVAMVFQGAMNSMNPVQSVGRQIVEPLEHHGIARGAQARARARELLELVGIPAGRIDHFPHEFSGGMRQRIGIAMALACSPKILIADEPTTALDVMVQAQILELLISLCSELGLALVLVTHDLPIVAQTCDRVAVMYGGRIVETGPMDTLFHEPRHPYTRRLFAATPDVSVSGAVRSIPGAPPRIDEDPPGCAFAPRCDCRIDVCTEARPRLLPAGPRHEAACHVETERPHD
jgi:peptide/nickel transport system ATP-binding protein